MASNNIYDWIFFCYILVMLALFLWHFFRPKKTYKNSFPKSFEDIIYFEDEEPLKLDENEPNNNEPQELDENEPNNNEPQELDENEPNNNEPQELDKDELNNDELEYNDKKQYLYVFVKFNSPDYYNSQEFAYISEIDDIEIGDGVLVETRYGTRKATVVRKGYYSDDNVPFPINKTKKIIKILTDDDDIYPNHSNSEGETADNQKKLTEKEEENLKKEITEDFILKLKNSDFYTDSVNIFLLENQYTIIGPMVPIIGKFFRLHTFYLKRRLLDCNITYYCNFEQDLFAKVIKFFEVYKINYCVFERENTIVLNKNFGTNNNYKFFLDAKFSPYINYISNSTIGMATEIFENSDIVKIGSIVEICNISDNDCFKIKIIIDNSNIVETREDISNQIQYIPYNSDLSQAILGLPVGKIVNVEYGCQIISYKIISIHNE